MTLPQPNQQGKFDFLDKKFANNKSAAAAATENVVEENSSAVVSRSTFKKIIRQPAKRLSCEELEDLKEKFVDFIKLDQSFQHDPSALSSPTSSSSISPSNYYQDAGSLPPPPLSLLLPPEPPTNVSIKSSRNSILSVDSSNPLITNSNNESGIYSTNSSALSTPPPRPEPPQRTVSIRNSAIYAQPSSILSLKTSNDDSVSIKSGSIYSSCRVATSQCHVRNSRSVFSIYEEEAETCSSSGLSSHSSSSAASSASSANNKNLLGNKLDRLTDFEVKKIESMYRSIGSIVCVSPCTCDLFTTTSEQIANLLNNCWRLELSSLVPIWIFDTGYNLKRTKKLTLLLVDRQTAFPLMTKPLLITDPFQFKNPNNDKQLTFKLSHELNKKMTASRNTNLSENSRHLVGLIQFLDFLCCHEFFKFYKEIVENPRNIEIFYLKNEKGKKSSEKALSHSSMTLNNNMTMMRSSNASSDKASNKFNHRYSEYIPYNINYDQISENGCSSLATTIKSNSTSMKTVVMQQPAHESKTAKLKTIRTITKSCISSPCAFQHVNSVKSNNDQHIKLLIENYSIYSQKNTNAQMSIINNSSENLQVRLRKK